MWAWNFSFHWIFEWECFPITKYVNKLRMRFRSCHFSFVKTFSRKSMPEIGIFSFDQLQFFLRQHRQKICFRRIFRFFPKSQIFKKWFLVIVDRFTDRSIQDDVSRTTVSFTYILHFFFRNKTFSQHENNCHHHFLDFVFLHSIDNKWFKLKIHIIIIITS